MKKFLKAAFQITPFQLGLITFFIVLKYVVTTYRIVDWIQKPVVLVCLGAGILFVITVGVTGLLEDRGESVETLKAKAGKSAIEKTLLFFSSWGTAMPVAIGLFIFLYFIAPTDWLSGLVLLAGMVSSNVFQFFTKKAPVDRESELKIGDD